ncbi:MAG: nucleotide exchange factor GrpE [Bacteroidia bacterium]|nr:nucleotide exchange factor GrpE [Bacteroidia bacterium]MDW8014908.1 nucleotide exchange factor GrpE [Bacteroidia bacterium]
MTEVELNQDQPLQEEHAILEKEAPSQDEREAELERLRAEVETWRERALRAAAELENYRRRVQREMTQQILSAQMDVLRPLLPLLDNIERGLQVAREAPDLERLREGLELIQRQFHHTLQKLSVQVISPEVGSLPDPAYHEVISTVPTPEGVQSHTIVEILEVGYLYQGHLLRPARVITTE